LSGLDTEIHTLLVIHRPVITQQTPPAPSQLAQLAVPLCSYAAFNLQADTGAMSLQTKISYTIWTKANYCLLF